MHSFGGDRLVTRRASRISDASLCACAQVTAVLKWKEASILPDSYAGVFPPNSQGPLVYNFGFCSSGFLSPANYAKCVNQQLTLQDINMQNMRDSPSVPVTFVQSKTDIVQMSFYVAIGMTTPNTSALITPKTFYSDVNKVFEVRAFSRCFVPTKRSLTVKCYCGLFLGIQPEPQFPDLLGKWRHALLHL